MIKFLSGTSFNGSQVPVCTNWSTTTETDPTESFAPLVSQETTGRCVANHYVTLSEISCFNKGRCNGEGKCLPCTQYKYGEGARMGITHSPPLSFFREFSKGFSDVELRSPHIRAGGAGVYATEQTQLPFHIIIRNIQAEIAQCCRWSEGDGLPTQFLLTTVIDGPDEISITDANGKPIVLKGIRVKNNAFPEDTGTETNPEGGSFFPVGTIVVAGWSNAPSFYLEPRTGLVKPGEGVVFKSQEDTLSVNAQAKIVANNVPATLVNALNAINYCGVQAGQKANIEINYYNSIRESSVPEDQILDALERANAAIESVNLITQAKVDAIGFADTAGDSSQDIINATTSEEINDASAVCSEALDGLAEQVDVANVNCGGEPAAESAAGQSRRVSSLSQSLRFAGRGGSTKCNLAFTESNSAAQWNSPVDGSLPCNGMRSDCKFYTGPTWEYATTEKMELGQKITAEAVQEVRFYSDDWSRYSDPEEVFRTRFTTSFIWAFKDFEPAGATPEIEDMILYKPKTLIAREATNESAPPDNPDTSEDAYETMRVERVSISNFENLQFDRSISRIQPGQETLDTERVTTYATLLKDFDVPNAIRLKIQHPPTDTDDPFIYRSWTPEFTNRISLFGSSSSDQTVFVVNNTALRNRQRYHDFYGSKDMFDIPEGLPGAAGGFVGQISEEFLQIFANLSAEKSTSQSPAVLGYDEVTSSRTGFWNSINQVDLVHNAINEIFVFIIIDPVNFIFDRVEVDYRVLHSVVGQTSFTAEDFTINDKGGKSKLGIAISNTVKSARLIAEAHQVMGSESVLIDHGYAAWRFKDRNLRFSTLDAGSDLSTGESVSGDDFSYVVAADADAFISNVSYRVVQYRAEETISNWYLLNDCGIIMAAIEDPAVNRVMPLTNQRGEFKALSPVLVNNGATGSVVAPWAPEKVILTIAGVDKEMVLIYRDVEGLGLPANYAIYGPAPGDENLFGRPDPSKNTLNIQYTYLRSQTHQKEGEPSTDPEGSGEVINNNFYDDQLRSHNQSITFSETGLDAGGARPDAITFDQQDYVFVFKDSEERPIGKKHVRFLVAYYNLACISVEIFYAWRSQCTTYGLVPDLFLATGGSNGRKDKDMSATINPDDLILGSRISGLLGTGPCNQIPNCGDHDILRLSRLRKEFETVVLVAADEEGDSFIQKAVYPSAGQLPGGVPVSYSEPPNSIWQLKRGTLWYPYTVCEPPRYNKTMMGKGQTDTTEIINETTSSAGVNSGQFGEGTFIPGVGIQGGLATREDETHHAFDEVTARILDIHPTLRACLSGYTYGNTVLVGGAAFSGYARKRGEVEQFWFEALGWVEPPFGNFGRSVLMCEVATKIGDYAPSANSTAFRWMPMFPEREDIGATVGLFGEALEPATYRLISTSCPLGGLGEVAPTTDSARYTHKSLITNRGGGGIEYPYVPYYPTFLPDALKGKEPEEQGVSPGQPVPIGTISTAWAWREQDSLVKRGQESSDAVIGMQYILPGYFLDNRRMEVMLRPEEGNYQVTYTAPSYNLDGTVSENAQLQLGNGPPREISIDFVNKVFGPADMPDTVYDTSLNLGDPPFPCEPRSSSNLQLNDLCGCEDNSADVGDNELPAIFVHGDTLAPGNFTALYSTNEMGPAFPTDIDRESIAEPCCACNYFLPQIYFKLDSRYIPTTPNVDPAFTNLTSMSYTWSRAPHGIGSSKGRDGIWAGQENRAQNYTKISSNSQGVFRVRPRTGQKTLARTLISAYFPSPLEAAAVLAKDGVGIRVAGKLESGDPKLLGGIPVSDAHESQGEAESITLNFTFDTFISIKSVTVYFLAGAGLQVPRVSLVGIPTENRVGDFPTTRAGRLLGESVLRANNTSVPGGFSSSDIKNGAVLFPVTIIPSQSDLVFWDRFYQEFNLVFDRRVNELSMGIHSVELRADILTSNTELVETIFIPERRYYTSEFTPAGKNPEEKLSGMDSCTAYWRTTSVGADQGGNRFRSYAWGPKINNESATGQGGGQPTIGGSVSFLESLQKIEYNKARALMPSPYTYNFVSFTPLDEQRWLSFLGGVLPAWETSLSVRVSNIEDVSSQEDVPLYGSVPDRSTWHAPGHAWMHDLDENYGACCEGCGQVQLVSYKYLHLHDNLAPIETAGFWDDFSAGQGGAGSVLPSAQVNPDIVTMREGDLLDQNGNPISADILNASGFRKDLEGNLILTGYTDSTIVG